MQDLQPIIGTDDLFGALTSKVNNAHSTLASSFLGASPPASPTEGQFWADSGTGYLWHYRGGSWHAIDEHTREVFQSLGSGDASGFFIPRPYRYDVISVVVLPVASTTGSDGSNNWELSLLNNTTGLQLFASNPTTNGDEWTQLVAWEQNVDQNATVELGQSLLCGFTRNGSPTVVPAAVGIRYRKRFD